MRLLFLFSVMLFLFLVSRSETTLIMPEGETVDLEINTSKVRLASGLSQDVIYDCWEKADMSIVKIFAPAKQLDLPADKSKLGLSESWRVLRSDSRFVLNEQRQKILETQFMSLLSARYLQGFYTYSLEKIII